MKYNWQQKNWPKFHFKSGVLGDLEASFFKNSGRLSATYGFISKEDSDDFKLKILSDEALKTSEIEGEILRRDSLHSSIANNLGIKVKKLKSSPAEIGISDLIADLHKSFDRPLTHKMLFSWHKMICTGRRDLVDIGRYRTHADPMQVVSGRIGSLKVHFEAPASKDVKAEMDKFISWFNKESKGLSVLVRAAIAHLYFLSIHPFEDGNGRIARALSEKIFAITLLRPSLITLSTIIEKNKKDYYANLESNSLTLDISDWIKYFSDVVISAQEQSIMLIDFLVYKAKFFDRFKDDFNDRQRKVVKKVFDAGIDGFEGGLSAENYIAISKTSRATATRDLAALVKMGAFTKTGELKSTRYYLSFD